MAIKNFVKVWLILAKNNLQNQLITPSSSILFVIGKLFNYIFSIITIYAIFSQVSSVKGYSLSQAIIIVLVFNFIDSFTQFFFRSLYFFRPILIRGDFDLDLLKPLPSFFRPIFSAPDFLDAPLIIIQIFTLIYFIFNFQVPISLPTLILSLAILTNGVILAFAIHLIIAAFAILTSEIDNLVMIYRSLGRAAIVPTDIYGRIFNFILSYIVPITIIMTVPAKAILGILTLEGVVYSFAFGSSFFAFSLRFWQFSLKRYTSASS